MADELAAIRGKMRFIAEARFPVAPQFLDVRGNVIAALQPVVAAQFPHWLSQPGTIVFVDRLEQPANEFVVSTDKIAYVREDHGSLQEFIDGAVKHFELAFDVVGKWVPRIDRLGVRFIEVLKFPGAPTFPKATESLRERFGLNFLDVDLKYTDLAVRMVHEYGNFYFGPTRSGEPWIKSSFRNPATRVPEVGFGVDVDSYATNLKVDKTADAIKGLRGVIDVSLSIESALCRRAGLVDG